MTKLSPFRVPGFSANHLHPLSNLVLQFTLLYKSRRDKMAEILFATLKNLKH